MILKAWASVEKHRKRRRIEAHPAQAGANVGLTALVVVVVLARLRRRLAADRDRALTKGVTTRVGSGGRFFERIPP
jgi:hypothetical protein